MQKAQCYFYFTYFAGSNELIELPHKDINSWGKSAAMTLRENGTIVLLLCAYGFFKEVKPSEPYLTQYLTGKSKHSCCIPTNFCIFKFCSSPLGVHNSRLQELNRPCGVWRCVSNMVLLQLRSTYAGIPADGSCEIQTNDNL